MPWPWRCGCRRRGSARSSAPIARARSAPRLARYFGTTPEFWLNLQSAYDLSLTVAESGAAIERDVDPRAA
jgi:plasmid maintenance system antidote protein VapI